MKKLLTILITTILGSVFFTLFFILPAHATDTNTTQTQTQTQTQQADNNRLHVNPRVVEYAVNAYRWAVKHDDVGNPSILTIVDFNRPSFRKRLWVIDLKNDQVLMHTYVAQGKNSGSVYATRFSNQPGSLESSPGVFTTARTTYDGEHGQSLRVHGLEPGINSNVYSRAVVIHPAWYVTPAFIKQNGYAGRSWGCFAVNPARASELMRLVKGGSVWFAYAKPELHDARVDHALSASGKQLYYAIMDANSNPVERFFDTA